MLLCISRSKIERIVLGIKDLLRWILQSAVVIKIYKIHSWCWSWGLRGLFNTLFLLILRLSYSRSSCRSRRSKILKLVLFLFFFRNLLRFFLSLLAFILKSIIPGCWFLMIFKLIISTQSLKPSLNKFLRYNTCCKLSFIIKAALVTY